MAAFRFTEREQWAPVCGGTDLPCHRRRCYEQNSQNIGHEAGWFVDREVSSR